jgi:hypothetical protein
MNEKMLGKIIKAEFGYCGYQESLIGLSLTLESEKDGWGCGTFIGDYHWGIIPTIHSKWTEGDRQQRCAEAIKKIDKILVDAKVDKVSDLVGIPVEVTFESNCIKDWRILTEVI